MSTVRMSNDEYRAGMALVTSAVRILVTAPVDQLRDNLARVEALAPILEPTAYQRGGSRNLDQQRRVLDAAHNLREVALSLVGDAGLASEISEWLREEGGDQ